MPNPSGCLRLATDEPATDTQDIEVTNGAVNPESTQPQTTRHPNDAAIEEILNFVRNRDTHCC